MCSTWAPALAYGQLIWPCKLFLSHCTNEAKNIFRARAAHHIYCWPWAKTRNRRYENALVDGVDLIMIQPEQSVFLLFLVPPRTANAQEVFRIFANQRFMLMDVESEWTVVRDGYHLIFARMLNGAISNWPRVYRDVFNHLKPGGWFEQVEIDWTPRCDDSSLPPNSALERWAHEVSSAMRQANRPISVDTAQTRAALADAGFVDFGEEIIQIPYNGWPDDPHDRQVGRWFNLSLYEGIQALSLAPLTRVKGWSPAQVEALLAQVKDEIRRRGYNGHHAYCYMYVTASSSTATASSHGIAGRRSNQNTNSGAGTYTRPGGHDETQSLMPPSLGTKEPGARPCQYIRYRLASALSDGTIAILGMDG